MTRESEGDMNSGLAKFDTTFGANPFVDPQNLTWFEQPVSILTTATPITGLKTRLESNNQFVYGAEASATSIISLYKFQVNNYSSNTADYDVASVIGGFSFDSFKYGQGIEFYGSTEKMFFGGDSAITKINFTGSGETVIGSGASIKGSTHPVAGFLGKIYFGNGGNIGEVDSTETVTTYNKLSPGFPSGTYVRDLDVTPDGNYLQITVARDSGPSLDGQALSVNYIASQDSYKFYWNGTDTGYTSYETYNGFTLTANQVFLDKNFTVGNDLGGGAIYENANKILSLPNVSNPNNGAVFSLNNLLGVAAPRYNTSTTTYQGELYLYGQYDNEVPPGLYRPLRFNSSSARDVAFVPSALVVSNLYHVPSIYGYANNVASTAKLYFTTTENKISGSPSAVYKTYKFSLLPIGTGTAIGGVYETQQETSLKLFRAVVSRKFKPTQVRFYTSALVANNSFQIDIIGSNGSPMSGGTQTFTVGTNVTAGQDYVWYTPQTSPTYSMGLRITNLGTVNWTGVKAEIEYEEAGV